MRDINRIPIVTNQFMEFWMKNPDLRFGQIVEIIKHELEVGKIFYIEDYDIIKALEKLNN